MRRILRVWPFYLATFSASSFSGTFFAACGPQRSRLWSLRSIDRASLKLIIQLLPSFFLIKADQAHTLALHNTKQALASEMAASVRNAVERLDETLASAHKKTEDLERP
jgi:hypothetical protein